MTYGDDNQDTTVLYEAMKREYSPYGEATSQYKQKGALAACRSRTRRMRCLSIDIIRLISGSGHLSAWYGYRLQQGLWELKMVKGSTMRLRAFPVNDKKLI